MTNTLIEQFYLLSYPRSGNSWVRYIIESITGGVTIGDDNFVCDTSIRKDIKGFRIEDNHVAAIKRHRMKLADDPSFGLVLILRDYHECMVRYAEHKNRYNKELAHSVVVDPASYMDLLFDFDNWDEDRRHLIYYEDLVENPELEIFRLLIFMRLVPDRLQQMDEFFTNIQNHHEKSVNSYSKTTSKSQTGGRVIDCHKFKLTPEERLEWDKQLRATFPEIYFKYLTRYATH